MNQNATSAGKTLVFCSFTAPTPTTLPKEISRQAEYIATDSTTLAALNTLHLPARLADEWLKPGESPELQASAIRRFDSWLTQCEFLRMATTYRGISLWTACENNLLRWRGFYDAELYQYLIPRIFSSRPDLTILWGDTTHPLLIAAAAYAQAHAWARIWHPIGSKFALGECVRPWGRVARRILQKKLRSFETSPTQSHRVVFVPYTSRHVGLLLSLLASAEKREWESLVVAGSEDAVRALQKAAVPFLPLWGFDKESLRPATQRLANWGRRLSIYKPLSELTSEEDIALWPLLYPKLKHMFDVRPGYGAIFTERFLEAAWYVNLAQSLISQLSPALIVVMNDLNVLGRTVVLTARQAGIPTLHLQHGSMGIRELWRQLHSDQIAVWGAIHQEHLVNAGIDPAHITITGNPKYDRLNKPTHPDAILELCHTLELAPELPVILVTTQPNDIEASRQQLQAVIIAAASILEAQIVVKLHPAENLPTYQALLMELEAPYIRLTRDLDLFTLIEASDVLITRFSTTGLDAMIRQKPVITLNFTGQPDILPYAEAGAAIGVYHPEDLPSALHAVLEDENVRTMLRHHQAAFVQRHAYKVDGQSTYRVLDLIDHLLEPL